MPRTLFLFFVTFAVFAVVNVVTGETLDVVWVTWTDKAALLPQYYSIIHRYGFNGIAEYYLMYDDVWRIIHQQACT
jgi:hypothetical protein